MDPNTQTPDQQVATGVPAPPQDMSQGGLIDALRSRGTLPAALPANMLAQSMQQVGPGPNIGLAVGSGALNAASGGNAALNPYLQQYQAQQNAQVQQALQYQQLQQQREAHQRMQDELAWKMTQGMVDSDDSEARLAGWKNRAKLAGPLGVHIPQNVIAGLGRGKLTKEQLQRAVGMLDDGQLPEDIGRVTGFSPQQVQQAQQIAESDGQRRLVGILTRSEAEAGRAKDQQASLELARNEWGFTDPKDPRVPFAFSYTQRTFGVPFNKATQAQKKEAVEKAEAVAPAKTETTATIKNALAESGLPTNTTDASMIKSALISFNARRFGERARLAAQQGQLGVAGALYKAETDKVLTNMASLRNLDHLIDDMDRLIAEGQELGITNNAPLINAMRQGFWTQVGGPDSKVAQWYRAFGTLDARIGDVAKAIEQVSPNRLAVQNVNRILGYHPKAGDPYGTQIRVMEELKKATKVVRDDVNNRAENSLQKFSAAAGAAGVPFLLGGGHGGVEAVEEEK